MLRPFKSVKGTGMRRSLFDLSYSKLMTIDMHEINAYVHYFFVPYNVVEKELHKEEV